MLALATTILWSPAQSEQRPASFDPVEFFKGRTRGDGTLKIVFQSPKKVSVESLGRVETDGSLILTQRVAEEGKAPRSRSWHLRQVAPGRFAGTLSDASGPVAVDVIGGRARIRYSDKDHLNFEQWLTPQGPKRVLNRMTVKRFGITVARLNEVIRKLD